MPRPHRPPSQRQSQWPSPDALHLFFVSKKEWAHRVYCVNHSNHFPSSRLGTSRTGLRLFFFIFAKFAWKFLEQKIVHFIFKFGCFPSDPPNVIPGGATDGVRAAEPGAVPGGQTADERRPVHHRPSGGPARWCVPDQWRWEPIHGASGFRSHRVLRASDHCFRLPR